ncbi:MAG: ABC transporter transmembrane domain-containing protein, partial [Pseudomonadota bacterium]
MVKTLWRPELKRWRVRMVAAFALTLMAKALAVAAPVFLGEGINLLSDAMPGDNSPAAQGGALRFAALGFVGCILIYGAARFFSNALPQVRDSFFVRVTQNMNRVVAQEAFLHAQKQSLHFHLSRRAGALNRIIERGSGAME